MKIWSAEINELEKLYNSIKGQFPDLDKELEHLIRTEDANVVMLYSRRCLEVIVSELCLNELKRPSKTEPLQGIIDKLNKEGKVPSHIISSMHSLNSLSVFGAHPKEFDPEQVKPVLNNLIIIIKWYLKHRNKGYETITEVSQGNDKEELKSKAVSRDKSRVRLILLLSILLCIVGAFAVFKIIKSHRQTRDLAKLEKSIAVLPFVNDSQDQENGYFINGLMDEILNNLQKIKDFRVLSRTSVEQYRGSNKPTIPKIAQALDVNYIVEGSGQKYGNTFRLRVQLIAANNERHLWAQSYEQEIKDTKDIFNIQNKVAQTIAEELKATITPEEKQLIEKKPTESITAYDFYLRGREEEKKYSLINLSTKQANERAEKMYRMALEYDSTFALAFTGLARIYWNKCLWKEKDYFSKNYMDSVLVLANVALSYDNKLPEAYDVRGSYYAAKGFTKQAIEEFDKAIRFNPNDWMAYYREAGWYLDNDQVKLIKNLQKAASLNHGSELPGLLRSLSLAYEVSGFREKANLCNIEAFKLDNDSVQYFENLAFGETLRGNLEKALELLNKGFSIDTNNIEILNLLGDSYMRNGQYQESLRYYIKFSARLKALGQFTPNNMHRIGYAYFKNGYKKEADYYFDKQIEYCYKAIKSGRPSYGGQSQYYIYYDLAGVFSFKGNEDKAYENLRNFNKLQRMPFWMVVTIKNDPLFHSIKNDPEFQKIVRDVEAKYNAEHERVMKLLEEQGML